MFTQNHYGFMYNFKMFDIKPYGIMYNIYYYRGA